MSEDEFEYQGRKYIAVDDINGECNKCHLDGKCVMGKGIPECLAHRRKDNRQVIFILED